VSSDKNRNRVVNEEADAGAAERKLEHVQSDVCYFRIGEIVATVEELSDRVWHERHAYLTLDWDAGGGRNTPDRDEVRQGKPGAILRLQVEANDGQTLGPALGAQLGLGKARMRRSASRRLFGPLRKSPRQLTRKRWFR
jgi:hypothetical protein